VNRVAALALKRGQSAPAISQYERELHANRARLKVERLARETTSNGQVIADKSPRNRPDTRFC
jgi:hypothetical protein